MYFIGFGCQIVLKDLTPELCGTLCAMDYRVFWKASTAAAYTA